jgi:hypothetical protein
MAFPTATLVYKVPVRGAGTVAQVQAAVAGAPVPFDPLDALGVRITSDVTTAADPVVRTIVLNLQPDVLATLTAALAGDGSSIAQVTVTNPGSGYIVPPVVATSSNSTTSPSFQSYLTLVALNLLAGGAAYSAQTTLTFIGGLPGGTSHKDSSTGRTTSRTIDPLLGPHAVASVAVSKAGRGYLPTDVVQFVGYGGRQAKGFPLVDSQGRIQEIVMTDMGSGYLTAPDVLISGGDGTAVLGANMCRGTPASAQLTIMGGVITAAALVTGGSGYVSQPEPLIFDPTDAGSGGSVSEALGVERVDVLNPGKGFFGTPSVAAINVFETVFGRAFQVNTPAALATLLFPFINLMTQAIQSRVASPVSVSLPT